MEHDRPAFQEFWWQGWIPADPALPTHTSVSSAYGCVWSFSGPMPVSPAPEASSRESTE
jgi:hypothetical protein